jgi:hypothetical protein
MKSSSLSFLLLIFLAGLIATLMAKHPCDIFQSPRQMNSIRSELLQKAITLCSSCLLFPRYRSYLSIGYALSLPLTQASVASASTLTKPYCLIFGGYQIPERAYASIKSSVQQTLPGSTVRFVPSFDSSLNDSIAMDTLPYKPKQSFLIGHSKGGAQALLYALNPTNRGTVKSVMLLDPVDTSDLTVISRLANETIPPELRILMFSTPFGGRSKYYRTAFTSSCAPVERSADRMFKEMRTSSSGPSAFKQVILITLPDIGHLQMIDSLEDLSFKGICAQSPELSTAAQVFVNRVIQYWISSSQDPNIIQQFIDGMSSFNADGLDYTIQTK